MGQITDNDIASVSDPESLGGLLQKLGYDVSQPVQFDATGLGMAAPSQHLVKDVRRLAVHVDAPGHLPIEVYYCQITKHTIEVRKALTAAFKDKPAAGQLLILTTSTFEQLDFLLVEKSAAAGKVTVTYQEFLVQRRRPARVKWRAVARLAVETQSPLGQWMRIVDAFHFARWAEDGFNNRNLFSDYFLKSRLTADKTIWKDYAEASRQLRATLANAKPIAHLSPADQVTHYVLDVLHVMGLGSAGKPTSADHLLYPANAPQDAKPAVAVLAYRWGRPLDRKDDDPKADRAEDVPGIRVVKVLEDEKVPWAIVTNGRDWRLYCAEAHSRATNYYEIDLPEAMAAGEGDAFRYFYLFFRAEAFAAKPGELCFLDKVRKGSEQFAKELGDKLRERVFKEVFPYLAQGFVDYRKQTLDQTTKPGDPFLQETYDATLMLLYRLLFLLYAESLDLLPVNEPAYAAISLGKLKHEVADAAGKLEDHAGETLKKRYTRSDTKLYDQLATLFAAISDGSVQHNVPVYNGGLFNSKPGTDDTTREAAASRFLSQYKVPDFCLARALDLLARGEDPKTHELVFVDYKSLGVRQLGSIYEGLLMYHVVVPQEDWEKDCQIEGLKVALVPSNKERKKSGSYFTPQHIVKYIVTQTVGPLLDEKFAKLAPEMRKAQRSYHENRQYEKKAELPSALQKAAEVVYGKYAHVVHDLLDIKVLDPAMGSGHFLVETVDYITDRVLEFLAGFPWNPVQHYADQRVRGPILDSMELQQIKIDEARLTDVNLIKRLVMKRCVYGVDLNPMAVELAKVSVWLDSFTIGAPLSFMDHHFRCGNSLIGSSIAQLREVATRENRLWPLDLGPLEIATKGMEIISQSTDVTLNEVHQSVDLFRKVGQGVEGYRVLLDCIVAERFGIAGASRMVADWNDFQPGHLEVTLASLPPKQQRLATQAVELARTERFLHWDIDFPDVFSATTRSAEERTFDAVVGNPPYGYRVLGDLKEGIEVDLGEAESENIVEHFLTRSLACLGIHGPWGMIIPKQIAYAVSWGRAREILGRTGRVCEVIDVCEAFDDVLLEQVVVLVNRAVKPTATVNIAEWSGEDIQPVGKLERSLMTRRIWPLYCVGRAGELIQKLAGHGAAFGDLFKIENGLKNVRSKIGAGPGHPCLIGDNLDRYRIVRNIQNIDPTVLSTEIRSRLCRPKILTQQIVSHLTNPLPYIRLAATWDGSDAAIFETAVACIARDGRLSASNAHALLAVLNSSYARWFFYDYVYCRSVRTMHFIDDYAAMLRLPGSWDGASANAFAELAPRGQDASLCALEWSHAISELHRMTSERCGSDSLSDWTGKDGFEDLDYFGWSARYPHYGPDGETLTDGRWFANGVAPHIEGQHPESQIPWDLIACVYPSYPLPGIDSDAWQTAAWLEFCDFLRKNKGKIGNAKIRADLTGSAAAENPTGPLRKLQETFLKYHQQIRDNRAKAAELDFLIDRIVFKLFDLTLDEQKLILSRVGPGRPLPPRRNRGKKEKTPAEPGLFG